MKQAAWLSLLPALAAGCADDGGSSARSGVYIVPAGPDTPAAEYPVLDLKAEATEGELRLDYTMPLLLVGVSQQVSLRGPLDAAGRFATLSGSAGTATCDRAPGGGLSLYCDEVLSGVQVDVAQVERLARASDPNEAAARVAIASRFASEPIGILEQR